MMAIGTNVAVVCLESVADDKERQHLLSKLAQHHQVGWACQLAIASMTHEV